MNFRTKNEKKLQKIGQINLLPETHRYIEGNRYREGISIERVDYNIGQINLIPETHRYSGDIHT